MNVEIGTEAMQFLFREYTNAIFVAVRNNICPISEWPLQPVDFFYDETQHFLLTFLRLEVSYSCHHKVLTYTVDYSAMSGVFRTIDTPPHPLYSLHPASVSSPRTKGGGVHALGGRGEGVGGQ
jgi:hypothetical protein